MWSGTISKRNADVSCYTRKCSVSIGYDEGISHNGYNCAARSAIGDVGKQMPSRVNPLKRERIRTTPTLWRVVLIMNNINHSVFAVACSCAHRNSRKAVTKPGAADLLSFYLFIRVPPHDAVRGIRFGRPDDMLVLVLH